MVILTSAKKKEIFTEIVRRIRAGDNFRDIYEAYKSQFPDDAVLAGKIVFFLDPRLEKEYRWQNRILVGLLLLSGIIKMISAVPLLRSMSSPLFMLLIFWVPFLNFFLAYFVFRRKALAYQAVGFLSILGLSQSLQRQQSDWVGALIILALFSAMIVLSFFLLAKLYPYRKLKKDKEGKRIIPDASIPPDNFNKMR